MENPRKAPWEFHGKSIDVSMHFPWNMSMGPSVDFPWNCHVSVVSVVQFHVSTEVAIIFRQSAAFFCCCWRCVITWTSTGLDCEEKWRTARKWEWDDSCWRKCSIAFFQFRNPSVINAGSALPIHGSVLSVSAHRRAEETENMLLFNAEVLPRKLLIPMTDRKSSTGFLRQLLTRNLRFLGAFPLLAKLAILVCRFVDKMYNHCSQSLIAELQSCPAS